MALFIISYDGWMDGWMNGYMLYIICVSVSNAQSMVWTEMGTVMTCLSAGLIIRMT